MVSKDDTLARFYSSAGLIRLLPLVRVGRRVPV
jgi:hypothetical protein